MPRVIGQETFDEVVRENINEFSMSPEDAVKDAILQFEAQGVDLGNIVTESLSRLSTGATEAVTSAVQRVVALQKDPCMTKDLVGALDALRHELDKSLAHKLLAGKGGCQDVLLDLLEEEDPNLAVLASAAGCLASLATGQPDLLDGRGADVMLRTLAAPLPSCVHAPVLEWAAQCCLKHEGNRQDLVKRGVAERLRPLLRSDAALSPSVRAACGLMRALVLDDDVRVEFGLAHEHARELATRVLCTLVDLAKRFDDAETLNELLMTLSALIVRNEFCGMFKDAGGLQLIKGIMEKQLQDKDLMQQCLKLLKVLAGNDDVKAAITSAGAAPLIVLAMNEHLDSAPLVGQACGTIAALTLRSPANSKLLVEQGVADAVLDGMRTHAKVLSVQKQGSWAIRNIVSRDKSLGSAFLQRDAEGVLREALKRHGAVYDHEYDIKSALRDLGCDVELRELWTGKGKGALN
ncbi:armadillo repeat-containing protein 6 homolog [Bacillus rossius redtenbacheri]|uniref:armadillo repeat-containing protein 6 homolog n=1 Tax=Bacillus rossius redtenbacheri TaxID=93214 RepID=UPI002FDD60A6